MLQLGILIINVNMTTPISRFVMEKVDIVMVGAEGVAESGGIINRVCLID